MFQFLLDALDFWSDAPRRLKAWAWAIALALAVVVVALLIDRWSGASNAVSPSRSPASPAAAPAGGAGAEG